MQSKLQTNWEQNRASLFVLNMVVVYALWKGFSYYVKHSSGWAHETWNHAIIVLGTFYATATSWLLNFAGENTGHAGIIILYPYLNKRIFVEDHCLAIPATVIFIGSIISFTGTWKNKLWFIAVGIFLIAVINITRLCFLCYTFAHFSKRFFDINHSVVYVIVTYTLVFLMIVWWMKKFATPTK